VLKRIILAGKRVEFDSDRLSYIILRDHWCHITVLNVHAPTEDKIDDVKDNFYKELERVFDKFSKYLKVGCLHPVACTFENFVRRFHCQSRQG
jgi:hypothetical protein